MSENGERFTGGCLCGALLYEAAGQPLYMGCCYRVDCRKASGSGFIPFMGISHAAVRFTGESREFRSKARRGGDSVRNFCPACGGLLFGGERGKSDSFTLYADSLDDPSAFRPTAAIFTRHHPEWALIPTDVTVFEDPPT